MAAIKSDKFKDKRQELKFFVFKIEYIKLYSVLFF